MASRPPAPWALVIIYALQDQKEMSNDFWFKPSAEPDLSTWDGIQWATYMYDTISNQLKDCLSIAVTMKGAACYLGAAAGTIGYEHYTNRAGTISGDVCPEDVSVVVEKYSTSFSRSGRGRWYFSGLPESFTTASYLNGTGNAAWTTFTAGLGVSLVDQGITYEPHIWGPAGAMWSILKTAAPVALLGTRRRRRFRF